VSQITEASIRKIASLARLNLSDEEVASFVPQMDKILSYIDTLDQLKDEEAEIKHELCRPDVRERDDTIVEPLDTSLILREAKEKVGTAFTVPRILG